MTRQDLGGTAGAVRRNYALLTPDTFVRAPLPGMKGATAIVHAAPALGAGFLQYTAELEPNGTLGTPAGQRFLYVLEGEVSVSAKGLDSVLGMDGYAYLSGPQHVVAAAKPARLAVIEKRYVALHAGETEPSPFAASERAVKGEPLLGDADLEVRCLIPPDSQFDFAVNTMTYQPGATLPMVETHVMEHGLLMLDGGIYRLADDWHPVRAGDFIWMGPFCPQWFGALGKTPARYLIYKDWNRNPLS